jgi:hypothetical protein
MRPQDIKIGEHYRFKTDPHYGFAKAIKVLKAKQDENTNTYAVVKCEHTVNKGDKFGFTRYFRPCDLVKC